MTRQDIIATAEAFKANGFIIILDQQQVDYEILDIDNISDPNDGFVNIAVDGLEPGEALFFINGTFSGL
jgi:hypothetical protein